jgi:O-antigen ligase
MIQKTKDFLKEHSILNLLIITIIFCIPLVWSRYLNANYVSAKFFWLYFVSAISLLVSFKSVLIPKLSKMTWVLFLLIFILHFITPLISEKPSDLIYLSKFITFCFMVYYFYTRKITSLEDLFKRITYPVLATAVFILIFAAMDFYKFRIRDLNIQSGYLLGSFGNVNMMSEFLILTTPFVFYWIKFKDRIPYFVKFVIFTLWVFFIMYCRSRSTWIGLGLWTAWELIKGGRRKELLAIPLAFVLYFAAMNSPSVESEAGDVKKDSFNERVSLYKATVALIKDHPLGVGFGHFDSYLVPYQLATDSKPNEYLHYDQPHSEILRWTAQLGWLGFVLMLGMFLTAAKTLLFGRKGEPPEINSIKNFLIASALTLAPQMLFQFPYFNPASILFLSFTFALFLGLFSVKKEILLNWKLRIPIFIIAIFGVAHAIAFVTSIFFESTQNEDIEKISIACQIYPINQNACFLRAYHLLKNQKYPEARIELQNGFSRFLYHRGLLRLLPSYLKNTSNDKSTCEAVFVYQLLFPTQKFFDATVIKSCTGYRAPFEFKNSMQIDNEYKYWLNRQLQ